jgi:hypothetical protein
MKSISGFNNSSLQGSSNLSALNSIGAGVDIAKTAMSNDVHFQTSTGGTSYSLPQGVYDYRGTLKQFDCIVQKWQDPENPEAEPEYRLRCVVGLTSFENYNVDEQGFLKNEQFVYNHRLTKWNAWPNGTFEYDTDDDSGIFLDDGYIKLTKNKNYKVFLWKINPTVDYWDESISAQIAVIEEGIAADTNVMPKYNGGGSMQTYIVSESESVENIVTADPFSGKIASFNPAEMLNDYINFDPSYLSIIRAVGDPLDEKEKHKDQYPTGEGSLSNYLGTNKIPSFLFKSSNPYTNFTFDGNTISGVPFGINWEKGTGGGGGAIAELTESGGTLSTYPNQGGELNGSAKDVIVGDDTAASPFPYNPSPTTTWAGDMAKLNIMTGIIDVNDFEVIIFNDLSDNTVVNFDTADLDIIANSQTSVTAATVEMVSGKPVGNVGFKEFDCARKEIAYIKWVAADSANPTAGGRFDVYQINNGPINFNYKPIMLDFKKVASQGEAHWTDPDVWVSPDIVEITLYWEGNGAYEEDTTKSKYKENSNNIGGFLPRSPTRSSG